MEQLILGMIIGLGMAALVITIFNIAINKDEVIKAYRPVVYVIAAVMTILLLMSQYIIK